MKTILYNHLKDSKDIEQFKVEVRSASKVLARYQDILRQELTAIDEEMESDTFLLAPDLQVRTFTWLARKKEIRKLIKLLDI